MSDERSNSAPSVPGSSERILAAAERLLSSRRAGFSMRELADEAGVSFATPFNQFGNKRAIMSALSAGRIAVMHDRLRAAVDDGSAVQRVLTAVEIAVQVMLEAPSANRVIMGTLGSPSPESGAVWKRSRALWAEAMGDGLGLKDPVLACETLPDQLAIAFRGVLSFWTAGEFTDDELIARARSAAAALLLAHVEKEKGTSLVAGIGKRDIAD